MIDLELELLSQNSEWRFLLEAYQAEQKAIPSSSDSEIDSDEGTNWLPRIQSVPGVEDDHLPRIHGKLIALGLLKFQLAGRHDGVVYQVSHQGKQVLNKLVESDAAERSNLAESA